MEGALARHGTLGIRSAHLEQFRCAAFVGLLRDRSLRIGLVPTCCWRRNGCVERYRGSHNYEVVYCRAYASHCLPQAEARTRARLNSAMDSCHSTLLVHKRTALSFGLVVVVHVLWTTSVTDRARLLAARTRYHACRSVIDNEPFRG